jgi:hypothetical protein
MRAPKRPFQIVCDCEQSNTRQRPLVVQRRLVAKVRMALN